MKISSDDILE